jgi:uncharacterized protein YecT (DUF1311 family)
MTHADIDLTERALIELATVEQRVQVALAYLNSGQGEMCALELIEAVKSNHRCKLLVVSLRWMDAPGTLKLLLKDQEKWLAERFNQVELLLAQRRRGRNL